LQFLPDLIFGHRSVTGDENRAFAWLSHHDHETDRCDCQPATNDPYKRSIHDFFLLVLCLVTWLKSPPKVISSNKPQAARHSARVNNACIAMLLQNFHYMIQVIEHSISNDLYLNLHEGNYWCPPVRPRTYAPERYQLGILFVSQSRLFAVK
jgi:hypothetical protein